MAYPSLERYQEALQHPANAFVDDELKRADVRKSGLGMPLALCGGFALTYTLTAGSKKYAVRCFHKESKALEKRYVAISNRLKVLNSPYFLDFSFRTDGIRIDRQLYPVVKMEWARGETLGEFLEANYRNKAALAKLRGALLELANYLQRERLAHGDIQTGNVMVGDGGGRIQLIDYDGMFVDELRTLGSSELGHRNFQHPARAGSNPFDASLDRFSLISLTMALRVLEEKPDLWTKTRSDIDGIIFRANDFIAPESSLVFNELAQHPALGVDVRNFAAVCRATYGSVPTLADFIARKNIPALQIVLNDHEAGMVARSYLAPYPVVDALDYAACLLHVGDRVELIGRIVEIKDSVTDKFYKGKRYVFLNFSPWRGKAVKINIWYEGLKVLGTTTPQSWVGKWISVVGLMEAPYKSKANAKNPYEHLGISVSQNNEMTVIDQAEAEFRLAGSRIAPATPATGSLNQTLLNKIGGASPHVSRPSPSVGLAPSGNTSSPNTNSTANQALLAQISKIAPNTNAGAAPQKVQPVRPTQPPSAQQPPPQPVGSRNSPSYKKPERSLLGKVLDFIFK